MGFSSLTQRLVSFNRRKQGRERLTRRRIEQFVRTETLEARMLLTGAPPVISDLRLVNDTVQAGDLITTDPCIHSDSIFELDLCSMVCV